MVLGVIGGSGLLNSKLFASLETEEVSTQHGPVVVRTGDVTLDGVTAPIVFVQRHAAEPGISYRPPHLVNHRSIMCALKAKNVDRILAICSVGALRSTLDFGAIVIADDYFCPADILAVSDGASAHKMPTIDDELRKVVLGALRGAGMNPVDGGVYVQSRGPRFETKAEIRFMAQNGDLVGMTGAHEATLSAELEIPYAMLCMVDNYANGIASEKLTLERFHAAQKLNVEKLENAINVALKDLFETGSNVAEGSPEFDTVLFPSYVVTVDEENSVLEDVAIAIKDGKIAAVVPHQQARGFTAKNTVDLTGQVVMPGLINSHTHTPMVYMRGFGDDMDLNVWLTQCIWPAEGKCVSADFVSDGTELAIAEMIKGGTTCFNDMYFFPGDAAKKIVSTGIRGVVGITLIEFPSAYAQNADDYLEKGSAIYKSMKDASPRLRFAVCPHSPYTVTEGHLEAAFKLAKEEDLPYHIHLHETKQEVEDSVAGNKTQFCHCSDQKCRPFANLDRLGLISERTLAVHMTQLTEEEISVVAEKKCNVVHCPSSNLKLASGMCPVAKLLDAGVNVALGTDGAASNNTLDMMKEMHMAALLGKGVSMDSKATDAKTVIRMATINGAKALGIADKVGSVEVGKYADLISVDLSQIETQPLYHVTSHLVYSCNRSNVTNVWVEGARLLDHRKLTTIDETALKTKIKTWHEVVKSVADE